MPPSFAKKLYLAKLKMVDSKKTKDLQLAMGSLNTARSRLSSPLNEPQLELNYADAITCFDRPYESVLDILMNLTGPHHPSIGWLSLDLNPEDLAATLLVLSGDRKMVKEYVSWVSQPHHLFDYGFDWSIRAAAHNGDLKMATWLVKNCEKMGLDDIQASKDFYADALADAARSQSHNIIDFFVMKGNYGGRKGMIRAMIAAVKDGHQDTVLYLFNRLFDSPPDSRTGKKISVTKHLKKQLQKVFFAACIHGRNDTLEFLLNRPIRISPVIARDAKGDYGIQLASLAGRTSTVSLLLSHDPDRRCSGNKDAMSCAVRNGHSDTAQFLLDQGFSVNERMRKRYYPLVSAALHGEASMIRWLLRNGAELCKHSPAGLHSAGPGKVLHEHIGVRALEIGATRGYEPVCRALLEAYVSPDDTSSLGSSKKDYHPMLAAMVHGKFACVDAMREFGAQEVNPRTSKFRRAYKAGKWIDWSAKGDPFEYGINEHMTVEWYRLSQLTIMEAMETWEDGEADFDWEDEEDDEDGYEVPDEDDWP
jgi:ankyrin repeat protein